MDHMPARRLTHAARGTLIALLLASAPSLTGCAGRQPALTAGDLRHARVSASSSYLGEVEVAAARLPAGVSVLDAIVRLRSEYLQPGSSSVVFLNGMRLRSLEELRGMRAQDLLDVRLLRGAEAQELVGSRADGRARVIVVRLKRGGGI